MDSAVDLTKFGFKAGERAELADDDWSPAGSEVIIVNLEPVPGSTQCIIRAGSEMRTVSLGDLRHL